MMRKSTKSGALDELLKLENWYEEDVLPDQTSFISFLKWMIFSQEY